MKQKVFTSLERDELNTCLDSLGSERYEVVVRNARESKTLQQIRALFGVWYEYLADYTGHDESYIHRWMKAKFLARIYIQNPVNSAQEQWVELLIIYQQNEQFSKLERHAKRISVSWSNVVQFKSYMEKVEQYWINQGIVLPKLRNNDE